MLAPLCALVVACWAAAYGVSRTRVCRRAAQWLEAVGCSGTVAPGAASIESEALNSWPGTFVTRTGQRSRLRAVYDVGIFAAGALLVCACAVVVVGAAQTVIPTRRVELHKRDAVLYPVVPGATVPLAHTVPLLCTAIFAQLIHEAGHALAAALDGFAPLRAGAMLVFPFVPVAYVVLPSMRRGTPERRRSALRIVAAGVWHNLLFLGALFAAVRAAQLLLLTDAHALLVEHSGADIRAWIPPGSAIVALGDRYVAELPADERLTLWHAFQAGNTLDTGRCVPLDLWSNASDACCAAPTYTQACFDDGSAGRCLDALRMYTELPPCGAACDGKCVTAVPHERLAHITVSDGVDVRKVVIRGSMNAAVTTQTLIPAVRLLVGSGARLVRYARLWYWYAMVTGVALCVFNMLPLPGLDGSAYVRIALEGCVSARGDGDAIDIDDVEDPMTSQERAEDQFSAYAQRIIERITLAATALALIGSIVSLM